MFVKKYGDICVSIFFAAVSIIMIIAAKMLPKSTVMDIGPDFMPLVVSVITLILSIILLVTSLKDLKANIAKAEEEGAAPCDYKKVALCFIAILIYAFVFRSIGFIIATLVFLPFVMFVLSPDDKKTKKDLLILIVITIVFTIVVYLLFRYGFKILLPTGLLSSVL